MEEKNISDLAADKLRNQMDAVLQDKGLKGFEATAVKYLCAPIGNMLVKFCYQNEEFAQAVERFDRPLIDLLKDIAKMSTREKPGVSDVEAYAKAVKFYLPAAEVICSFRVNLPEERDDDLLDLESFAEPQQSSAIILDVFGTEDL
jgi:hypothetical protein